MGKISTKIVACLVLFFVGTAQLFAEAAPSAHTAGRPRVALVLAGGGALGIAHIGIIKKIEELGIPVDIVVGTSMGAIIGGLYSMGYNGSELEKIVFGADWIDLFSEGGEFSSEPFSNKIDRARYLGEMRFDRKGIKASGGVLSGKKILNLMDALTLSIPSPISFDSLPRQYRCVSVDVETGKPFVNKEGSLADAMRSSMSIPGVFDPFFLNGHYYIDGGVVDNLPIDVARSLGADLIIAVDLVDLSNPDADSLTRTPLTALTRTIDIMTRNNVLPQLPHADLVITVDTRGYTTADFSKATEIFAVGEKTANENADALKNFRSRCLVNGSVPTAVTRPPMPVISEISVEGETANDRMRVRALFEPLVGTSPSAWDVEKRLSKLDSDGRYDYIRVRLDSEANKPTLAVKVAHKNNQGSAARIAFSANATYSKYLTSKLMITPGYVLRGFPLKDSSLSLDGEIVDTPGFDFVFSQPFLDRFSAKLFSSYHYNLDTWLATSSSGYQVSTEFWTSGLSIGAELANACEFSFGWSRDWVDQDELSDMVNGTPVRTASILHMDVAIRKTDAPVLPLRGIAGDFNFKNSLTSLGSERSFATFQTSGGIFLPAPSAFYLSFRWIAGTDFSNKTSVVNMAPPFYKPDLSNRGLFPGLLTVPERIGSHVIGNGIGIRYDLNEKNLKGKFPVLILADLAAGSAVDDVTDFSLTGDKIHWTLAVGAGIRLSNAFAVVLRGGICRNTAKENLPFVAMDLGSINY